MERYKHLHLWLIIPFLIAIFGFMKSYFLNFTAASWGNHLHGISATMWFIFIIIQPWLAVTGKIKQHKKLGILGIFLAGCVFVSALAMIPENIRFAQVEGSSPVAPDYFLYGVSFFDLISITGFAFSVIMAVIKSKKLHEHAMWMISTVLWALMPALARLVLMPSMMLGGPIDFSVLAMLTTPFIILTAIIIMIKIKQAHPAMLLVIAGHISVFFIQTLGKNEIWIHIANSLFSFK